MEQRAVGRSGLRVSRMGLASHTWGRETDAEDAAAQLVAFVEAGGTLVDTSPVYQGGAAQRMLGELVGELVPRDDLVISGCAGLVPVPGVTDPDGGPAAGIHWSVDASRRTLMRQLDRTLAELGTDYLDIWSVAAWLRDRPGVASMIVGARDIGQLTGVLAAETLELPRAIAAALDDVSGI